MTDGKNNGEPPKRAEKARGLEHPWTVSAQDALETLETSEQGLAEKEAKKRRKRYGANRLSPPKGKSAWRIFVEQLKNLIVGLLAVAALISFAFGQWLEGVAIILAILINVLIGFFTEWRAIRSMEALRQMSRVTAKVLRNGDMQNVAAEKLVPGDVIFLEGGDIVPADIRLFEAARLEADESALTGESLPVAKSIEELPEDTDLADRKNMVFKGTSITGGSGHGVVASIGRGTELGRISELAEAAEEEVTPLERRLDRLGRRLIWITLAIAGVVMAVGILAGKDLFLIIETSIALAVAAVPEGLPIVATIALARGMWRMARRNALINNLSAVETLGSITKVCTDKTGTLTENRMTVAAFALALGNPDDIRKISVHGDDNNGVRFDMSGETVGMEDRSILREAVETGVLCNNAFFDEPENREAESEESVGDPLEIALLELGWTVGLEREALLETHPEVREVAFDPDTNMMATIHQEDQHFRIAVKGAPEAVIESCSRVRIDGGDDVEMTEDLRSRWREQNQRLAEDGLRILGLASGKAGSSDADPYNDLTFVGLIGLFDPPRENIDQSIEAFRTAGIEVVMVTGDQPATAAQIGAELNMDHDPGTNVFRGADLKNPDELSESRRAELLKGVIFSRVAPEQKLDLIELFQRNGDVVAMTGDGVNDAPALKKADVGIAMGRRGTQVAREAADVVLRDDAFESIVAAVEQGRSIFNNIRKFILFLLSGNVGEIMIVAFALLMGLPLPLRPLQILYLNMIGDVFPALALGVGKGDASVMKDPPRDPQESIITAQQWTEIFAYGLIIAATVLGVFAVALLRWELDVEQAVTISFLTLSFARLWHVFNMKDWGAGLFRNEITENGFVWGALILCTGLLLLGVYVPILAMVLDLVHPTLNQWALIIGTSFIPVVIVQIVKARTIGRLLGVRVR